MKSCLLKQNGELIFNCGLEVIIIVHTLYFSNDPISNPGADVINKF